MLLKNLNTMTSEKSNTNEKLPNISNNFNISDAEMNIYCAFKRNCAKMERSKKH